MNRGAQFTCIAREHDPQGGGSREGWERGGRRRGKVKLWSKSTTIDYGDGRGKEIHFLWVSRPPRSEWMNTALRNPLMLQEGSFSLPPLCLLGDGREWKKWRRATESKKKRRRRRRKETPHLAGILPCNSCCYILFVCFWGTLRTSSPSPSPSSLPTVPLPSVSPFLPRVRPHLDPGIWVRLYVYNLLRRRAHRGYLGYSRTSFVGCTIRKSNYTPGPFPGRRLFFSEQASEV